MPAQDLQHQVVVRAMRKDGWQIEKEQVYIRFGTRRLWVDLRASKADGTVVLVEIKGFDANASAVEASTCSSRRTIHDLSGRTTFS